VKNLISLLMVSLLINDESLRSVLDEFAVLIVLHRADFDPDRGDQGLECVNTLLEIAVRHELWMLACHQKDVSESQIVKMFGLCNDLRDGKSGAENGIVARKPAILAVIHTLVGEVERGEKSHRFAEVSACQGLALTGHTLELSVGAGIE
jgi:hypothetical protein